MGRVSGAGQKGVARIFCFLRGQDILFHRDIKAAIGIPVLVHVQIRVLQCTHSQWWFGSRGWDGRARRIVEIAEGKEFWLSQAPTGGPNTGTRGETEVNSEFEIWFVLW